MGKKHFKEGKRVNVYIPLAQRETAELIDNLSGFLQIALDNAPSIMAWAILKEVKPKKFYQVNKLEDVIDEFNNKYPLDQLTQKRLGKWHKPSQKLPDVLL